MVVLFLAAGARRRVPLYETFIEGAKELEIDGVAMIGKQRGHLAK